MLSIIAFSTVLLMLCIQLKARFEQMLPLAVLFMMLLLSLLGMVQQLSFVDTLAIPAMCLCLFPMIHALATGKRSLHTLRRDLFTYALTPSFFCFIALALLLWHATEPMTVFWRDDLEHWALAPKSLILFNGLANGAEHLNLNYGSYTPGVQVLQWWALHLAGGWSEATLHFTLFLLYYVFLLPLGSCITWKKVYLLPVLFAFCLIFPTWGNVLSYLTLGVDTLLALCFGYALMQAIRLPMNKQLSLTKLAFALMGLVMIKQVGLLLAAMVLLVLFAANAHRGQKPFPLLLCIAAPFMLWGAWMLYCRATELTGVHITSIFTHLHAMLSGTYVPPEGAAELLPTFWYALTTPYTGYFVYETSALLGVPKIFWFAVMSCFPLLLAWGKLYSFRQMARLTLAFAFMTLLYISIQYFSFYTAFYEESTVYIRNNRENMIFLLERYLAPISIGIPLVNIGLILQSCASKKKPSHMPSLIIVFVLVTILGVSSTNFSVMKEELIPSNYIQYDRSVGSEVLVREDHAWGEALEGYPQAHVLVGLEPQSDYLKDLHYAFAPADFSTQNPSFTGSPEALSQYLRENHITHLICFEDNNPLYKAAEGLVIEDEYLYTYELYKIVEEDGKLLLQEFTW